MCILLTTANICPSQLSSLNYSLKENFEKLNYRLIVAHTLLTRRHGETRI